MSIYVNSAFVLLALLPLKMCAARASAGADVVLRSRATVLLENCSCSDGECQSPQPDGYTMNCSTIRSGLTLTGCEHNTGGSPVKCSAVSGEEKTLTGCNISSESALGGSPPCSKSPCFLKLPGDSNGECGGRRIKLTSSGSGGGGGVLCCGFISGQNRINEQQQQFGQRGNNSDTSTSSREMESALKASPGSGIAASTTDGDSSHSTPRGPESSERDGTSEKLSASNSTTTPTKNDVQNEGAELGAMKVVVKCAAASLFISSAFF
ncbi:hypothetical protein, conserved in T. vivax [Trypanosoma vivax Y486]|uniref:Uncharacterized protein n=1 Tax=Trypanosoma vivax (strain Y486) TaxID=1055687 RepID=F9WKY0_TRYVY|nr:hypothetical protein, conserved in T. vivax [Trypanosoma vivax Y486]|eukprot:CCD18163.1 hypothetical protein, conserved in T. vivax [Trypanosoma vivax Y486]